MFNISDQRVSNNYDISNCEDVNLSSSGKNNIFHDEKIFFNSKSIVSFLNLPQIYHMSKFGGVLKQLTDILNSS